jgi:hypothetical protein
MCQTSAMPISIHVDHEARLVRAVAAGPVTFQDTWSYHEKLVLEDALSYAKLMDATEATFVHDDEEMMRLGARVSAYRDVGDRGPVAVIASNEEQRGMLRRYFNLTGDAFPSRIFDTEFEARRWLRGIAEER